MPSYISHAIMGNDLFDISNKNNIFRIPITRDELRGYSLGADLAILSNKIKKDPHNYYTQAFFLNMIKYIKENKLNENSHVMSLLYGHIAHYFLDINIHPLVYYIEKECQKVGLIPVHHLIEGYFSSYLTKKILNKDIMDINGDYFKEVNLLNLKCIKLLNKVYGKTYGDFTIIKSYQSVISLFLTIEKLIKNKNCITKETLINFSKFRQFMELNNLTYNDLHNESHEIYTNPVTGEKHRESLIELYDKSLDMTIEAIKMVNEYLYNHENVDLLTKVFGDLSYDTGVKSSFGKKFIYVKKIRKKKLSFGNI